MRLVWTIILVVLTFLAVSSGITKVILMEQELNFFSKYGFSNPILISYGAIQLIGGALLPFRKTRFAAAAVVAMTFIVSLVVLLADGNMPLSAVTAVATLLLGAVMVQSRRAEAPDA